MGSSSMGSNICNAEAAAAVAGVAAAAPPPPPAVEIDKQ